ncbi:MAG TPA: hypothetical protein VKQ72_15345, partial [Aggregatilineales bacterium]|nr:hypothetical protein [Aggregatilineales bacterium]
MRLNNFKIIIPGALLLLAIGILGRTTLHSDNAGSVLPTGTATIQTSGESDLVSCYGLGDLNCADW